MAKVASIRPIKRKENMANLVAKQLIDLIVSGKFPAGERLPSEKELCEMFEVGRNTLREATRALNILGLSISVCRKGCLLLGVLITFIPVKCSFPVSTDMIMWKS